ncbi:RNA binding protein, putative [Ricinus communis]|uniref:RNA binding protein, putative n=1 Tax=Ricinus communis TaxID=3988 RepID=B9S9A9_RICCO|nr:RNA binding protein, putative [Ricinus communis]
MSYQYVENEVVEIDKREGGHDGSYYSAIISGIVGQNQYMVKYRSVFTDAARTKHLNEVVNSAVMRPEPPDGNEWNFHKDDKVDAFSNNAWRAGTLVAKVGDMFRVRLTHNQGDVNASLIRHHYEWDEEENAWNSDYLFNHTQHGTIPKAVASDHESNVGEDNQCTTSEESTGAFGPPLDDDSSPSSITSRRNIHTRILGCSSYTCRNSLATSIADTATIPKVAFRYGTPATKILFKVVQLLKSISNINLAMIVELYPESLWHMILLL